MSRYNILQCIYAVSYTHLDVYKRQEYNVGDKVLLKNRELPSTIEGIAKKLLLLYTGPYTITKKNGNNIYEIMDNKPRETRDIQPVSNNDILFRTSINLNENFSNHMKEFFKK